VIELRGCKVSDFDRNNPVRARSGRRVDDDLVTFPVSHYAPADRRVYGQLAVGDVGFPRADHLVAADLTGIEVFQGYYSPKTYLFEKELVADYYFTTGKLFLEVVDPFLEVRVPFTRKHELLVLDFDAIAPRLMQFVQDLRADNTPEMGQFS